MPRGRTRKISETDSLRLNVSSTSFYNDLSGESGLDASPEKILRNGSYFPVTPEKDTPKCVRRIRSRIAEKLAARRQAAIDKMDQNASKRNARNLSPFDARHVINARASSSGRGRSLTPPRPPTPPPRPPISPVRAPPADSVKSPREGQSSSSSEKSEEKSIRTEAVQNLSNISDVSLNTEPPAAAEGLLDNVLMSDISSDALEEDGGEDELDEHGYVRIRSDRESVATPTPTVSTPSSSATPPRPRRRLIDRFEHQEPTTTLPLRPGAPRYLGETSGPAQNSGREPRLGHYNERQIPVGFEGVPPGTHFINKWRSISYQMNFIFDPDMELQRIRITRAEDGATKNVRPLEATESNLMEVVADGFSGMEDLD